MIISLQRDSNMDNLIWRVEPGLKKRDEARKRAPVVKLRAGALRRIAVRIEIFADVAVPPPLVEHERGHLLAKRLPPLAHDRHVIVLLERPVRQDRQRAPDVPAPV